MCPKKENSKPNRIEEPAVSYSVSKSKPNGVDLASFDFDKEFENGFTPEEAKAESIKRIREWWGK
jgi:hypothetical protein